MKRAFLALAAAMACGAVQAQSSVTLYGVIDVNLEYVNKVGVVPSAANGYNPGTGHSVFRENSAATLARVGACAARKTSVAG